MPQDERPKIDVEACTEFATGRFFKRKLPFKRARSEGKRSKKTSTALSQADQEANDVALLADVLSSSHSSIEVIKLLLVEKMIL